MLAQWDEKWLQNIVAQENAGLSQEYAENNLEVVIYFCGGRVGTLHM